MEFDEFAKEINKEWQSQFGYPKSKLFNQEELENLMLAAIHGTGHADEFLEDSDDQISDEMIKDVMSIVRWAEGIRVGESLLNLILKGMVLPVGVDPKEGLISKLAPWADVIEPDEFFGGLA